MKKIKSTKQLEAEKNRLKLQQHELADKISGNWKDIKESVKPVNIIKERFSSVLKDKTESNENVSGSILNDTVSSLGKKVLRKLANKVVNRFKK